MNRQVWFWGGAFLMPLGVAVLVFTDLPLIGAVVYVSSLVFMFSSPSR